MRFRLLSIAFISMILMISGCSILNRLVYQPDINQGNYLTAEQISKLKKGMNKQQVIYVLGSPMLQDPFGTDTWIYVFYQQLGHEQPTQKTLTLTFNSNEELINIDNK